MLRASAKTDVRHNVTVNIFDGLFFGIGMGFASSTTVIPLFLDNLTTSTALIGVMASMQMVGWQLPQILTANRVAKMARYKPLVLMMSIQERWPLLGLALVAFLLPVLGTTVALILTVILICWKSIGGGLTATGWQSMIGKIIPPNRWGAFWGTQAAAATGMMACGSFVAGMILKDIDFPENFGISFLIAGICLAIGWWFLAWTREDMHAVPEQQSALSWSHLVRILRQDANLQMFILARMVAQFSWMAVAFYTIYGKRHLGMDAADAGIMFAVLTTAEAVLSPGLGWLGDRWSYRSVLALCMLGMAGSAFVALLAPTFGWLYLAFALAGFGGSGLWTVAMTMTLEFGTEQERPYYIGITNTLTAPATLIAPFIGGQLADLFGFSVTFSVAIFAAVLTAVVLMTVVREPASLRVKTTPCSNH